MTGSPLNLADADLKGFEAIDPGHYNAVVFAMTLDAVKNTDGTGKMPAGTPMIKIQFRITDDINGSTNRRVFWQGIVPPKDYDKKKAAVMKGMIVRAFIGLGDKEEDVLSAKYDPDYEDYIGRECVVVVGKEQKKINGVLVDEWNNPVKSIKAAGSITGSGGGLL